MKIAQSKFTIRYSQLNFTIVCLLFFALGVSATGFIFLKNQWFLVPLIFCLLLIFIPTKYTKPC